MTALYGIPALLLLVLALGISLVLAAAGQIWVHRSFRRQDFIAHNEVGGTIMAVSGTLYAVMLGLLTVAMWQHYLEARELVVMESDADIDVWHTAVGLPPSARERVRGDVLRYAQIMTGREWPLMKQGGNDATAAMIGMDATDATGSLVPANSGQSNAQSITLQQLTIMHDARQQRIATNMAGLAWFEWLILLLGGSCIICFCWLFGLHNARVHLLMTAMVTVIIVSALVLLFELQYPFRSDVGIGPDAWNDAVAHIHQMQSGAMPDMQ
ncbi:MAG TPA: hypothetical protein VHT03_02635 [Rhizomicrobium sp.]|jgi:hypothetical protein|nr:hypothetical protein [Rhizomicrobium sp.]